MSTDEHLNRIYIRKPAIREMQKLDPDDQRKVNEIIERLKNSDTRNIKSLEGFAFNRTRSGFLRVIWQKNGKDIHIIKVGSRREVYRNLNQRSTQANAIDITDLYDENLSETARQLTDEEAEALVSDTDNIPTYHYGSQLKSSLYEFLSGEYRFSPVPTADQESILSCICTSNSNENWLIQSPPGTGKTICATILARRKHIEKWNVILFAPHELSEELRKFPGLQEKSEASESEASLFIGTFNSWVRLRYPNLLPSIPTPAQELECLKDAAKYSGVNDMEISSRDVDLYHAFVLGRGSNRDSAFLVDQERVKSLSRIQSRRFEKKLRDIGKKLHRTNLAKTIASHPPIQTTESPTLIMVDEAQEFLLAELHALVKIKESWQQKGSTTFLALLGDLNQRVKPTGFRWEDLALGRPESLKINYRNTRNILKFANGILDIAPRTSGRHLPVPTPPEYSHEEGEKVKLLRLDSREEAFQFLDRLGTASPSAEGKWLIRQMMVQCKVLWPAPTVSRTDMVIFDASKAKGREFESCVAFNLFLGQGEPTLGEAFLWYTMLTRACSRLLVVALPEEIERVGERYFSGCEIVTDVRQTIQWITEVADDVDIKELVADVRGRLLNECKKGTPFWDTYDAIRHAEIDVESWESEAIPLLRKHPRDSLEKEAERIKDPSLKALLYRAAKASWLAVSSMEADTDSPEYDRIVSSIANELDEQGLHLDASRIRNIYLNSSSWPIDSFYNIANIRGSLPSLLIKYFCQDIQKDLEVFSREISK